MQYYYKLKRNYFAISNCKLKLTQITISYYLFLLLRSLIYKRQRFFHDASRIA